MRIAIVHLGNISQLIPATTVIRGIKKQDVNTRITWVVERKSFCYVNKYNKDVSRTISFNQFISENKDYDLLVNLYPYFPEDVRINFNIKNATGFCFHSYL